MVATTPPTELIPQPTLARRVEANIEELIVTMQAHPTVHKAAVASERRMIHLWVSELGTDMR